MKHIAFDLKRLVKKSRETERGELLKYFRDRLNTPRMSEGMPPITMSRMGFILTGIPTKDLYYIKRVCNDAPHFSKKFWWLVNPEKHKDKKLTR